MIFRVLIAACGALIVTGGLLLTMDSLTSLFENRSGERYFRITDVLPKPEPGRPERPTAARRQPAGLETEAANPDTMLPIELPEIPDTVSPDLSGPDRIRLEPENE
ncbi:MAG TPA: hypothetical protein VIV64_02660 [Gammaproteobacteria bacterium]|jgi:hypothetical protein